MGLSKRAYTGNVFITEVLINVYCLKEKGKIVFTGNVHSVANFLGVSDRQVYEYAKRKYRFKKKYALRHAKQP